MAEPEQTADQSMRSGRSVWQIGYVINSYPLPSHSFIRREIAAVERQGHAVHRFAMRGDASRLTDSADLAEHVLTERIHDRGLAGFLTALVRASGASPRAMTRALNVARRRAAAGESSFARQIAWLAEGAIIARRAKELRLDHLHAHFGTNSTRIAAYARLLGGPPFSFTVHGPEEFDDPRGLDLGGKLAAAAFAVSVSSFGRSQLLRWAESRDWDKVHVVHCGLRPDEFPDPVPVPETGGLRFVAVGRFVEQKGFGVLLRAFAQARESRPDLHLTLVGDGPMRPQIEAEIRSAGLNGAVELTGWQDEAGVRRAMTRAHILAVPSFAEGLPVVIMEAMALARPVIATMIAGIPELVRPGVDGWLVPAGDTQALANAILAAAETPHETLSKLGLAGRERVFARHDVDESARRLVSLIHASLTRG